MADSISNLSILPMTDQASPEPAISETVKSIAAFGLLVGITLWRARDAIERAARQAQEDHIRAERLAAYKKRHRWKGSDVRPLLSIGVNEIAQRRLATVKGRGRPVVQAHRPLQDVLVDKELWWNLGDAVIRRRSVLAC